MSIIIPLTPRPVAAAGESAGGLRIPVRLGEGVGSTGVQQREDQAVRAVAAAVASSQTAESLSLAREAGADDPNPKTRYDPGVRFGSIVQADLKPVLDEVTRLQGDRSDAPSPTEEQRVVAAAVGADPVLVAGAQSKLQGNDKAGVAAREWVAVLDPTLLHRAARAAAKHRSLGQAQPSVEDLKQLEDKVDKGLAEISAKLTEIDKKVTETNKHVAEVDKRLKVVERKVGVP